MGIQRTICQTAHSRTTRIKYWRWKSMIQCLITLYLMHRAGTEQAWNASTESMMRLGVRWTPSDRNRLQGKMKYIDD